MLYNPRLQNQAATFKQGVMLKCSKPSQYQPGGVAFVPILWTACPPHVKKIPSSQPTTEGNDSSAVKATTVACASLCHCELHPSCCRAANKGKLR